MRMAKMVGENHIYIMTDSTDAMFYCDLPDRLTHNKNPRHVWCDFSGSPVPYQDTIKKIYKLFDSVEVISITN